MAMDGIVPVMNMNGDGNGNGWGNSGWSSLVGGAIGAWAGSAWNGNRWNNGGAAPVQTPMSNGASTLAFGETFLMDQMSSARSDLNAIGRDQLIQNGTIQGEIARNQSRTEAAIYTTGLQGQIQQKDNVIAQLNASRSAEIQGMRNAFDLQSAISSCCCNTQQGLERQGSLIRETIMQEGCATRALIEKVERDALLRESCADKSKIAQLETQAHSTKLMQEGMAAMQNSMGQMLSTILSRMPQSGSGSSSGGTSTPTSA